MVTIIRDRVQAMIEKGMTLEQVKAAKPTADYDPRYGATSGRWTTDMFVEAVYAHARRRQKPRRAGRPRATTRLDHGGRPASPRLRGSCPGHRPVPRGSCGPGLWRVGIRPRAGPRRRSGRRLRGRAAPIDLTGTWVSIVTEDWRWRMRDAAQGRLRQPAADAAGDEGGRRVGSGARHGGRRAVPRLRRAGHHARARPRFASRWENDTTLKVETEAGTQTRLFHFGAAGAAAARRRLAGHVGRATGRSRRRAARRRRAAAGRCGSITTNMRPGYLRKNGVPYSANARVTEYFNRTNEPNGDPWLVVTTMIEDPPYLNARFVDELALQESAGRLALESDALRSHLIGPVRLGATFTPAPPSWRAESNALSERCESKAGSANPACTIRGAGSHPAAARRAGRRSRPRRAGADAAARREGAASS